MEMLKVLVVDDEARMRKLVKDFLTIKGSGGRRWGTGAGDVFCSKGCCFNYSGCDDAEDGWMGSVSDDPAIFADSDYHADSEERGAG